MIRLSKLTDYGIVLMLHMAKQSTETHFTARELATLSELPLPTVSKILKQLHAYGLVDSKLGVSGGYRLAKSPQAITVVEMVSALEGPLFLTECSGRSHLNCAIEASCPAKTPWQLINKAIIQTLEKMTLAEMGAVFTIKTSNLHVVNSDE